MAHLVMLCSMSHSTFRGQSSKLSITTPNIGRIDVFKFEQRRTYGFSGDGGGKNPSCVNRETLSQLIQVSAIFPFSNLCIT